MWRAVATGIAYAVIVFAAGFAFGAMRVVLLVPKLGDVLAVMVELPFILTVSWLTCGGLVERFDVPPVHTLRLITGGIAFITLMSAELSLSALAFGQSLSDLLKSYRELPGLLGLGGQLAFAAFPVIQKMSG